MKREKRASKSRSVASRRPRIRHEYDDSGSHRIVVIEPGATHEGFWASYAGIATLAHGGKLYAAATAYWEGIFPSLFMMVSPGEPWIEAEVRGTQPRLIDVKVRNSVILTPKGDSPWSAK